MTAAKVMDVIARLSDNAGQASDAVSAYTQVKMEDAPRCPKHFQSQRVQLYGYVFRDTSGPNHGQTSKTPWILSNEFYTDNRWPLLGKTFFLSQFYSGLGWRKVQGLFLSVYVDDLKNDWKKAEYGSHVEEIDEKR